MLKTDGMLLNMHLIYLLHLMEYMRESRGPQGRHKGRVGQVGLSSLRRKNKQIALALLPAIMCSYIYSIYIYTYILILHLSRLFSFCFPGGKNGWGGATTPRPSLRVTLEASLTECVSRTPHVFGHENLPPLQSQRPSP